MKRGKGLAALLAAGISVTAVLGGCGSDEPAEQNNASQKERDNNRTKQEAPDPKPGIEEQQADAIEAI